MSTDDGKSETRAALAEQHNAKFARKVGLEAPAQGEGPKAGPPAFTSGDAGEGPKGPPQFSSDDEGPGEGPDLDDDDAADDTAPAAKSSS